jgi:hypothetical protein
MGGLLLTVALGSALALATSGAVGAAPNKGGGGSTTTTTTKPNSSNSQSSAFAKLVIKPASIGHVQVQTAGASTFQPGTDGEALHVGDTVKTDSVGQAEIDYAANTYTRLDVNTTFTIRKLTDNQGNRQVQGDLTSGQTWNRTVALTQSESFQQTAGGATAAVSGTAFAVTCTTPTQCTFTGVVDNVTLTGNGQTKTLNPLSQCVSTSGNLCAALSALTPDQLALIQWIQQNVLLDFLEHGIGNGIFDPFGGTVQVNNGVVQSFTPSTPNQAFTAITPAPPPPPPTIDATNPVLAGGAYQASGQTGGGCTRGNRTNYVATSGIAVGDDCSVDFLVNATAGAMRPFLIQFTVLPTQFGVLNFGSSPVVTNMRYQPSDVFTFFATDIGSTDTGSTSFTFEAVDAANAALSAAQTVNVNVSADCDDGISCTTSTATVTNNGGSTTTTTPAVVTTPPTPAPTTPTTTATTTPTTTATTTPTTSATTNTTEPSPTP